MTTYKYATPWNKQDTNRMLSKIKKHVPTAEIADLLGRTESAVRSRASRLGISLRH